jgi:hypothetical protein
LNQSLPWDYWLAESTPEELDRLIDLRRIQLNQEPPQSDTSDDSVSNSETASETMKQPPFKGFRDSTTRFTDLKLDYKQARELVLKLIPLLQN